MNHNYNNLDIFANLRAAVVDLKSTASQCQKDALDLVIRHIDAEKLAFYKQTRKELLGLLNQLESTNTEDEVEKERIARIQKAVMQAAKIDAMTPPPPTPTPPLTIGVTSASAAAAAKITAVTNNDQGELVY